MFVEWSPDGILTSHSIHNFGSATLDTTSNHYNVQALIFASEKERRLPLDMVTLMVIKRITNALLGGFNLEQLIRNYLLGFLFFKSRCCRLLPKTILVQNQKKINAA